MPEPPDADLLPSSATDRRNRFDALAQRASQLTGRPLFFMFCVIMIVGWVPTVGLMNFNSSQLVLNTMTQIVTFLLVALLQNSETRADNATQHKLNAIALGLSDLLNERTASTDEIRDHIRELQLAVGVEHRESAT